MMKARSRDGWTDGEGAASEYMYPVGPLCARTLATHRTGPSCRDVQRRWQASSTLYRCKPPRNTLPSATAKSSSLPYCHHSTGRTCSRPIRRISIPGRWRDPVMEVDGGKLYGASVGHAAAGQHIRGQRGETPSWHPPPFPVWASFDLAVAGDGWRYYSQSPTWPQQVGVQ